MINNKKGFTLMELLGVMVILGLLLLVVFPSLLKAGENSKDRKLHEYYNIVKEASKLYATSVDNEKIGDGNQVGCTRFSLEALIEAELVKPYQDKEYLVNLSSGEVIPDTTTLADNMKGITVRNNKGKLGINFSLLFTPRENFKNRKQEKQIGEVDNIDTCDSAPNRTNNDLSLKVLNSFNSGGYIKDTITNGNYIHYSNNLWLIYKKEADGTLKAVSTELVTMLPFMEENNTKPVNYENSIIKDWLNSVYSKTFSNPDKYLVVSSFKTSSSKTYKSRVGLLDFDDIEKLKTRFRQFSWSSEVLGAEPGISRSQRYKEKTQVNGVRPVINFLAESQVIRGKGTKDDPFLLEDNFIKENSSVRYLKPGDYVMIYLKSKNLNIPRTFRVSSDFSSTQGFYMTAIDIEREFGLNLLETEKTLKSDKCIKAFRKIEKYEKENVNSILTATQELFNILRGITELETSSQFKGFKSDDWETIAGDCLSSTVDSATGKPIKVVNRRYQCDFDYQSFTPEENIKLDANVCPDQKDKLHYSFDRSPVYRYLRNIYLFGYRKLYKEEFKNESTGGAVFVETEVNSCMEIFGTYQQSSSSNVINFKNFVPKPICSINQSTLTGINLNRQTKVTIPKVGGLYQAPPSMSDDYDFIWTSTPWQAYEQNSYDSTIHVFQKDGIGKTVKMSDAGATLPVITMSRDLVVTGGHGTLNSPYTVGEKP